MNIEHLKLLFFFGTVVCFCLTFIVFISTWRYHIRIKRLGKITMSASNIVGIEFVIMTLKIIRGYAPLLSKNHLSEDEGYSLEFRIDYSINFLQELKNNGEKV